MRKERQTNIAMSKRYSFRKSIRPIFDEDDDDQQQRDSFGRKRVPVVDCLLDSSSSSSSSSDEREVENHQSILWLTFNELCHIRYVLARTESQTIQSRNLCFRCRKNLHQFLFLSFISHFLTDHICYICQQNICKKCAFSNFQLPSSKLTIPVRIQTLIRPSTIIDIQSKNIKSNTQAKTICFDCLQVILLVYIYLDKQNTIHFSR